MFSEAHSVQERKPHTLRRQAGTFLAVGVGLFALSEQTDLLTQPESATQKEDSERGPFQGGWVPGCEVQVCNYTSGAPPGA